MRKVLIVIAVVVAATAGLVWWLLREPEAAGGAPQTSLDGASQELPFVRGPSVAQEDLDAGVGRVSGRVTAEDGAPVSGARVRLYAQAPEIELLECALCHTPVLDCEDLSTIKRVMQGLRDKTIGPPVAIAEVITAPDGAFSFEDAPLGGQVVAVKGQLSGESACDPEPLELVLEPPLVQEVHVADFEGKALGAARVTLYSPREGTLVEKRVDAEGRVTLESPDPRAWFFAELDGTLPAGQRLQGGGEVVLTPPRTLIIHTRLGGQPVDAEVEVFMHGEPRKFRTRQGLLQFDQLPFGYYTVNVSSDALAAAEQGVELVKPVTELDFELRRGAKLLVTVLTASGDPLEQVSGSLSGNDGSAAGDAEKGALLSLGPVPEGEYMLSLSAEGMVSIVRPVDLKPGETTLEFTMRPAPRLTGVVLGPEGKPVAGARVSVFDADLEISIALTDEEGKFEVELNYPGSFVLRAEHLRHGVAEGKAHVPGPPVTLRLAALGVLEVEVIDADGTSIPPDMMVRSERDQSIRWIDSEEGKVGRLAGLPSGAYVLEKTVPDRLPLSLSVDILEGKVTKVTLRAEPGASISGTVVNHLGKPVELAMVSVSGRGEMVTTGNDGRFEWKGVVPGAAELFAMHPSGAESARVKVVAPAREVVLVIPAISRVTGRVVDDKGAIVRSFEANGESVKADDGRFDVPAPGHTLDVSVEGYSSTFLAAAEGELGDVVVRKEPVVEGDVLDGEGKPVSGATVMATLDSTPATTDANGRFKVVISSEEAQELVATRGAMSGRTPVRVGAVAHIVMQRGTAISGKVIDAGGKGVPTFVTASSRTTQRPIEIDTDENGRFHLDLSLGVWVFSTRYNRVQRAIEVRGAQMELTLGDEAGACGLTVHSSKPIDGVWLLAGPMASNEGPWDLAGRVAGSVEIPVAVPATEVHAHGLPCGSYTLAASIENLVAPTVRVELRSAAQRVEVVARSEGESAPPQEPVP